MAPRSLEHDARRYLVLATTTPGVPTSLLRDLRLALAHLKHAHTLLRHLTDSLDQDDCRIHTELERLKQRCPQYTLDEARIHTRLLALKAERRRLAIQHDDRIRTLHLHLASLLARIAPLLDEP